MAAAKVVKLTPEEKQAKKDADAKIKTDAKAARQAVQDANKIAQADLKAREKVITDKAAYDKTPSGKLAIIKAGEKTTADAAAAKTIEDNKKIIEAARQKGITAQAKVDAVRPASANPYAGGGGGPAGSGSQIQTRPTFAMPKGIDAAYVNDIRSKLMPVRDPALSPANTMKNGGRVASKAFAKGGIVKSTKPAAKTTSRGDGCAQRGRTKGVMR